MAMIPMEYAGGGQSLTITAGTDLSVNRNGSFVNGNHVHIFVFFDVTDNLTGATNKVFGTGLPIPKSSSDNGFGYAIIYDGTNHIGNGYVNSSGQLKQSTMSNIASGSQMRFVIDYYTN